jgi:hypothetical protein
MSGPSDARVHLAQAIAELKATGMPGRSLAPTLDRLLRLKPKAQYQTESISAANAAKAKQSRPAGWVSDPHRVIQLLAAAVEEEWAVCVSVGGAEVIVLPYAVEDGRLSGDDPVTGEEIDLPVALLNGVRVLDDDEQYRALSGV